MEIAKISAEEESAYRYLQALRLLKTYPHCPYYQFKRTGWTKRYIYKCNSCGYKWSPRKSSISENTRIQYNLRKDDFMS